MLIPRRAMHATNTKRQHRKQEPMARDRTGLDALRPMSPFDEIERMDIKVEHAALDEEQTMFDPDVHPKLPHPKEEGTTDLDGKRNVDVMVDTPPIDPIGTFDLTEDDLRELDPF